MTGGDKLGIDRVTGQKVGARFFRIIARFGEAEATLFERESRLSNILKYLGCLVITNE